MKTKIERELELLAADMMCGKDQERVYRRLNIFRAKRAKFRLCYWIERWTVWLSRDVFNEPTHTWVWHNSRLNLIKRGEI